MPYEYTIENLSAETFVQRRLATRAARGVGAVIYESPYLVGTRPSTTIAVRTERAWYLRRLDEDSWRWAELWRAGT